MFEKMALCGFAMLGVLLVGCGDSSAETGEDQNVTTGAFSICRPDASSPCTPAPGSDLRKEISDLLRSSISADLETDGVAPKDGAVKFVFKHLLVQNSHAYVSATIVRADGRTNFDLTGTKYDGKPSTVQALLDLESGSEFTHQIGIGLEPKHFACAFVNHDFEFQAPGAYPGANMGRDCRANPPNGVTGGIDKDANGDLTCHGPECAG
jgi:hypothetical protein